VTVFLLVANVDEYPRVVCYATTTGAADAMLAQARAEFESIERALAEPRDRYDSAIRATRDDSLPERYPGSGGPSRSSDHPSWRLLELARERFAREFDDIMRSAMDERAFARESCESQDPGYRVITVRQWTQPDLS